MVAFHVVVAMSVAHAQVSEGETEIVNVRETDERLGPLVYTLVGLGVASLVATLVFWFLTRPARAEKGSS